MANNEKYKASNTVCAMYNNFIKVANNLICDERRRLGVPDDFKYNPHTGEFVAPPNKEK